MIKAVMQKRDMQKGKGTPNCIGNSSDITRASPWKKKSELNRPSALSLIREKE